MISSNTSIGAEQETPRKGCTSFPFAHRYCTCDKCVDFRNTTGMDETNFLHNLSTSDILYELEKRVNDARMKQFSDEMLTAEMRRRDCMCRHQPTVNSKLVKSSSSSRPSDGKYP